MIAVFQGGKEKRTVFFSSPTLISELMQKAETGFDFPCSKQGKCGKCKVKVNGDVSPVTEQEAALLTKQELENDIRLACCTFAYGDIQINYTIPENLLQSCEKEIGNFLEKLDKKTVYNFICDIGSTTIRVRVVDKQSMIHHDLSFVNSQVSFGSDIMSRLKYANEHGADKLRECIRKPFDIIGNSLSVESAVVTGNTSMLHIFFGSETSGMMKYPFTPSSLFGFEEDGIYYPPCISAFVGADISCGILKSDLENSENSLLIDVGTNCEMAFNANGIIYCCSVAAGPAFEGFSTSSGERAGSSSINKVYLNKNDICYETVSGETPTGLSGSGIIDLLSVLLKNGILSKDGYLKDNFFIPNSDVFITPEDVRQIQLAKASVSAGIEMLCKGREVSKVFIAGNFGNSLDIESCIEIGLFPKSFMEKTEFIGNSSLDGGEMLIEKENRKKLGEIIKKCKLVELAGTDDFAKKYIENIDFQNH